VRVLAVGQIEWYGAEMSLGREDSAYWGADIFFLQLLSHRTLPVLVLVPPVLQGARVVFYSDFHLTLDHV